jgi:hypothetical protein
MPETSGDRMPTSFDDPSLTWGPVNEAVAAPPATETSTEPPVSDPPPAAATLPPEATPKVGEAPSTDGPIPFERHKAILEAQRAEADQKWQRVAWADTLIQSGKTQQQVQEALQLFDGIDQDPAGFLERFYHTLQSHPQLAPQVRSWAGKVLGGGRRPIDAVDLVNDPEPQPDFQDEKGTPLFSAPQLAKWQTWRERQFETKLNERINPLLQRDEQARRQEQTQAEFQRTYDTLSKQLEDFRSKPHFTEHEADIKAFLAERQWTPTLAEAYVHVLTTKVLPTLSETARTQTLTELKTQAAASTGKPSAAAPASTPRITSFNDDRLKW